MCINVPTYYNTTYMHIRSAPHGPGRWNLINLRSKLMIISSRKGVCSPLVMKAGKYEVSQSPYEWGPIQDPGSCFRSLRRPTCGRSCVAFLMEWRCFSFLPGPKSSVRDDKLQFGVRSSEILTRASSKPLNQ